MHYILISYYFSCALWLFKPIESTGTPNHSDRSSDPARLVDTEAYNQSSRNRFGISCTSYIDLGLLDLVMECARMLCKPIASRSTPNHNDRSSDPANSTGANAYSQNDCERFAIACILNLDIGLFDPVVECVCMFAAFFAQT